MNDRIRKNLNNFVNKLHNGNYIFMSNNFVDFDFSSLNKDDFIYCDCPYSFGGCLQRKSSKLNEVLTTNY